MDFGAFVESQRAHVTSPERRRENEELIRRYGHLFSNENVANLTADEFKAFLSFTNNKHWIAIHRQSGLLISDMDRLRGALKILVDEGKPIRERLNILFPKGKSSFIKGLGRAVATPILTLVYPEQYGVFNLKSESGLRQFGLLPKVEANASFADRYIAVNEVLLRLAQEYSLSLLELDELFGNIETETAIWVPEAEAYIAAFEHFKAQNLINRIQWKLLEAHYQADDYAIFSSSLYKTLGLPGLEVVNSNYGKLAGRFIEYLGIQLPEGHIKMNALAQIGQEPPYIWVMRPEVIQALESLKWFERPQAQEENDVFEPATLDSEITTRDTVARRRVGQDKLRTQLLLYWQRCAVTECATIGILRSSHIKPWKVSNNEERLDPFNSLLLIPNLDALFDKGYITFADTGELVVSEQLRQDDAKSLGISKALRLRKVDKRHLVYLQYHRENVFR